MWSRIVLCLLVAVRTRGSGISNDVAYERKLNHIESNGWTVLERKTNDQILNSTPLKLLSAEPSAVTTPEEEDLCDDECREEDEVRSLVTRIAQNVEDYFLKTGNGSSLVEGRGKKKRKYRKGEMQFLIKALVGLKVALLGIVLPLGVIVAKVLSWKAVTLSLMAFMLAKIVFVKNLFMGKSTPPSSPTQPPSPPIVIHSSAPSHDHVWKRHSEPQIHVKPEVHVHQSEEQFHGWDDAHNRNWQWGRSFEGDHDLVFRKWMDRKR